MDKHVDPESARSRTAAKIVGIVIGLSFGVVGVAALVLLGVSLFRDADSMPLYYRVIGSLIAVGFVAIGGGLVYGALTADKDRGGA